MAKQTGEIQLTGSIDGLCFYEDNGQFLVRTSNPITRDRFLNDKRFERSRWQNTEFAAAVQACKAMRQDLGSIERDFADQYFYSRLCGALRKLMTAAGPADMGMRPILVSQYGYLLKGTEMNSSCLFHRAFNAGYKIVPLHNTGGALLRIEPFIPRKALLQKPKRATDFQVVCCAVSLSDHFYLPKKNSYSPVLPEINGLAATGKTDIMKIIDWPVEQLEIPCRLNIEALPAQAGLILFAGIRYYRNDRGIMRAMRKGGNCMGVV